MVVAEIRLKRDKHFREFLDKFPHSRVLSMGSGRPATSFPYRAILLAKETSMEKQLSFEPNTRLTPEEYLRLERAAETKSEYLKGEMFSMPGVTREHNLINGNIVFELQSQLVDRPCEIYFCDMRIKVSASGLYTYPDVAVVCNPPIFEDDHRDTLLNPQLIIEVLSESTESYDRGKKFSHYQMIETLQEYVLVSQANCHVERYTRHGKGEWIYSTSTDPNGQLELNSIACRLSLRTLYRRVEFAA
jgi:Uma2 family endonuclease